MATHRAKFSGLWLVDPGERARATAGAVVSGKQAESLQSIDDDIQMVIVATPNHLHFPLALEALTRGAHVLIEKPFVIWPDEGRHLAQIAAASDRIIAINQTRRLFSLTRDLRRRISGGEFGRLKSIVHREGTRLIWPFESGAAFASGAQRTGVIMDFGVHVVDFYHYLLQPAWSLASATHDGFDGPEGLAEIELQAGDAPVSIRLSRYQPQENVARLLFENAEISFSVYATDAYTVRPLGNARPQSVVNAQAAGASPADLLVLNFLAACEKREPAICDAESSLPVIAILDEIYNRAGRYSETLGAV